MSGFSVRLAGPGDLGAVDALLARAYPRLLKADYPPSVLVTALPLISRAQPGLVTGGSYYVAVTDVGDIIGAGGWTQRRGAPGLGDVRHLVTDDRQIRRGVGRAIMAAAHDQARSAGVRLMDCKATRTAEPFYAAMGYRRLGEITVALRAGISFPAVQMQRRL
ncbi:MAG: GNAT family N-acetyltransferase [Rhodobacteraceae bacterium]|nr:GNAT family N-acetyltransferase [Paracoccaceae bacterium]